MKTENELWAAGGYAIGILAIVAAGGAGPGELVFSGPGGVERLAVGNVLWCNLPGAVYRFERFSVAQRCGEWLLLADDGYERDPLRIGWQEMVFRKPGETIHRAAPARGACPPAAWVGAAVDVLG